MRILKKVTNVLRGFSSYDVIDNNVYHHFHQPVESRTITLNGKVIESSNTDFLHKSDFQRVMMYQNNIICL